MSAVHLRQRRSHHACWVIDDEAAWRERATSFLAEGNRFGEKTVVFGPEGGETLRELGPAAVMAIDPYVAFLECGALDPETLFATFREQLGIARDEGYAGLRLCADMDWLVPAGPPMDALVAFEVLLDRVVSELGVTVACAYRTASFDEGAIVAMLCVHPVSSGHDDEPPFCLVADESAGWQLSGQVDIAGTSTFAAAFAASARAAREFDLGGLDFIDVAGMRTIAEIARSEGVSVRLRGTRGSLRRAWKLAGFDALAPSVELVP